MRILALICILCFPFSRPVYAQEGFVPSSEPLVRLAEAQWNNSRVSGTRIGALPSTTAGNLRLPLTVVRDAKGEWTWEEVIPYVRKAERIFEQCDVRISPITLVELSHPQLADFTPSTDYLITQDFPRPDAYRPMVVFNSGTNGQVYANADYYQWHSHPELSRHVVFIDYWALGFLGTAVMNESFKNVVAHELLHTILNVGHNQIPGNILNDTNTRGASMTPEQCEGLRRSPLIR